MTTITLEQAKRLTVGTILYHTTNKNADRTPQRWRVNGKVKIWKRNPECVNVPLKHGLYNFGRMTEYTLNCFSLNN